MAVRRGATLPAIGSVDAFQHALLGARAVAYIDPAAGGSSGVYLSQLFDKMGIAAQIKAKVVLVPGGLVAQRVVSGEADIAVHQISEILAVPSAVLVGPIPPPSRTTRRRRAAWQPARASRRRQMPCWRCCAATPRAAP